jgi:hypothetical protein
MGQQAFNATDASNSNFIGFNAGLQQQVLNSQISLEVLVMEQLLQFKFLWGDWLWSNKC